MSAPRIVVAGDFSWEMYEPAICDALRAEGAQVFELHAQQLFGPTSLLRRAQSKLVLGPGPVLANAAFVAAAARHQPDLMLAWRAPWLSPRAIQLARLAGAKRIALYCNDDPFGPDRELRIWRAWRKSVPAADLVLAYREQNLAELKSAGARAVKLFRSSYAARDRPIELTAADRARFGCDVIFVGHCEPDGRLEAMDALLRSGLSVRIFGTHWERYASGRAWESMLPIVPLRGDDYVRAIAAAKAAVVFLSARNRDTYTRRCFEIPAIGTAMLAPRTPDLLTLFDEQEALFWSSPQELVAQARRAVEDAPLRAGIAAAGHARVLRDGHDARARARELLSLIPTRSR